MKRLAVTGASGLIGNRLCTSLSGAGHEVLRLVRRPAATPDEIPWNPARGEILSRELNGLDAVIHLGGENLAAARWTPGQKESIYHSRVDSTALLCDALAGLKEKPQVLLTASAIGYYGDRGEEILTEESPSGNDFLARVCRDWEEATLPARQAGIRVVRLRFGVVLSSEGGLLGKLLPFFRWGLGGRLGDGRQVVSWIGREDLVRAIVFLASQPLVRGPVNLTAPGAVTNREFTATLARVVRRPALFPLPARLIRWVWGERGEALMLKSSRVKPEILEKSGFVFTHPDLVSALEAEIGPGRSAPRPPS